MKGIEITGKISRLFLILFIFLFCFVNVSFSGEGEHIEYVGDRIASESAPDRLVQNEVKEGKSILLRLGRTHFDPLTRPPERKAGIEQIQTYDREQTGYYIIQFDGPVENSWKEALKGTGANIFDYIPDFAFIIRMDSKEENTVRALPHVRWLGIYQPSYRISQKALDKVLTKGKDSAEDEFPDVLLRITVFPGEDLDRIRTEITALGGMILDEVTTEWKSTLKVKIHPDRIADLPPISGIKWVEPWPKWRLFNDKSTDVMNVRTPRNTHGLYGTGQTVCVCDTGLDQGSDNPADLHDDFEDGSGGSRVTQIFDRVGDGADDVNSGHGTHVAGSVLGNGLESGSDPSSDTFPLHCFAGMAPKANLIFQAVQDNSTGSLSGLPSDLNVLFSQADGAGADLHTNSWGSSVSGRYTSSSQDVDEYMWNYKNFLILTSAGNAGIDMDGDGVVDLYSMGSPATSKNILTVGASEGNRPSFTRTYGQASPDKFSVAPIYSDRRADDPDGMAAFSSRGPCLDGRYKPDIVAPGTNIISTRSSVASGTGWGVYDDYYMYMGGTSMACPLTAGAAALMREYLINEKGFTSPSAALIKAALLNSAEDISPGQHGTGAAQEIPDSPVPNNVEGWGRLNLGNGVYPTAPFNIFYYDEQNSLNTGEYREYTVNVLDPGSPLKINLVWTDYPGSTAAQGGLVNDLDLRVTDPSSTVHYPDGASQKSTVSALAYDNEWSGYFLTSDKVAVRFTPLSYPVNVDSATFWFCNPDKKTTDVDVVVYDDNGTDGMPGTELFRKTLTYVPTGGVTLGITGVSISSGDFYIALEKYDTDMGAYICLTDPSDRSYLHNGSAWALSGYATYIRANVRGADYSTSFDRVNNVVGLTMNSPAAGTYTVKVSGYNVPYGPQPYALVVSGSVTASSSSGNSLYFPHIASQTGGWETEICVINTSDTQTLNGTFKAYNDAGEFVSEIDAVTLAPHGRREITVGDEFTNPADIGYIVFESDSSAVVGYTKFYVDGHYRVAVPAVSDLEINAGDIYISHIASNSNWGTGINLLNTTSSPKTLTIEFDNGAIETKTLAANEHSSFMIRHLFGGQSQPDIHCAIIKDAGGIIGQELFTSSVWNIMSGILLNGDTATSIYYPHTASENGWGTGIHAYNPSDTDCDITITPYTAAGDLLPPVYDTIGGKEQYADLVSRIGVPVDTAWLKMDAASPITGFELFANTNLLAGYTGVGITGTEGIFAKLEKDGATGIAFVNIENSSATVTLTAYDDSDAVIATNMLGLAAHEKVGGFAEDIFTGDISNATYITYSSDREVVGSQINASSDGMMLDGLPGM
jgi:hypothetical protein